jgi:hypothetical protein
MDQERDNPPRRGNWPACSSHLVLERPRSWSPLDCGVGSGRLTAVSGTGQSGESSGEGSERCPRCRGERDFVSSGFFAGPRPAEELCSKCLTGHEPGYVEMPEPDWRFGRWLQRFFR